MEQEVPSLKRQREEDSTTTTLQTGELVDGEVEETFKKQKSIKDIISILEEDEDEPNEDISSLITTLQQEISPSESSVSDSLLTNEMISSSKPSALDHCSSFSSKDFQEDDEELGTGDEEGEKVMRHLLEASDDELGIPNGSSDVVSNSSGEEGSIGKNELVVVGGEDLIGGGGGGGGIFDFGGVGGGMWEFEDETANYYALLQSELFMGAAAGV